MTEENTPSHQCHCKSTKYDKIAACTIASVVISISTVLLMKTLSNKN